jgi:GT2 family glycosyltransferase
MDRILIVIVTFNGQTYINRCLESIYDQTNTEIIVIDNSSTDKTIDIVKNSFPKVKLIANKENIGFGQANNIGLKYALENDFAFILLLNQDTYIDINTISSLIKAIDQNQEYGILSPLHYYSEHKLQKSFSIHIKANNSLVDGLENKLFTTEIYDLPFINAAIWMMNIDCIKKVGGFCPEFFHYGEDDNYCHRVLYHGFKIGIVPSLSAFHYSDEKHSKYFSKKQTELMIIQEKINILNPLINYNHTAKLIYYFLRILKNLLLFRNQSFVLIRFFDLFKKIKIYKLLGFRDQSKTTQPLYLNINK